jgi:hypothetical protein
MKIAKKNTLAIRCPTCGAKPGEKCELAPASRAPSPIKTAAWHRRKNNFSASRNAITDLAAAS